MLDVYEKSPSRMQDTRVRSAIEEVANFVEKIPEMNVKFEGETFALRTQKQVSTNDTSSYDTCENELDVVAKNIEQHLKNYGYKSVKVTPVENGYDYHPLANNTWRGTVVVVSKTYELQAEA